MNFVLFYHSLLSDWNHGNAHFLRGVVCELIERGHRVTVYEHRSAWSRVNLLRDHGREAIDDLFDVYPQLRSASRFYDRRLDLDEALDGADVVIAHEWSDAALVLALRQHRIRSGSYSLLFHDTHHRTATAGDGLGSYELEGFDGALVYGEALRELYRRRGLADRVWTWHEAADVRVFRPVEHERRGDLVWIGNWGDDERTEELHEFLFRPVEALELEASVFGVRYPEQVQASLSAAGIHHGGWLPNYRVPNTVAAFGATIHVPRRPYVELLPGIPTIRPFEALACGIPLVCAPWEDVEGLFSPGEDYLVARDGAEMQRHLRDVLHDSGLALELATAGRATVEARHTCAHRVDELLAILAELGAPAAAPAAQGDGVSHSLDAQPLRSQA